MSTPIRYDQQYCPIARGLDLLGDRWTLLIVREVASGPQRFSDLQRNLPGIAATVLTDRLRSMAEDGLIEIYVDASSARKNRYVLGPEGRRALPVLASLVQFGMPILEPPNAETSVRPIMAVRAGILAYFDVAAAKGIKQKYVIYLDGTAFTIDSRAEIVATVTSPDLVVRIQNAQTLIDIRQGRSTFARLLKQGAISCEGTKTARTQFCAIYRLV